MKTLSQMAASDQVIKLGGKDYILSPIDLGDLGTVLDWIQHEPIQQATQEIEAFGGHLPESERLDIIRKARKKTEDFRDVREGHTVDPEIKAWASLYMNRKMMSLEGIQLMLWLSLRKACPNMSREEAASLVTEGNREALQERMDNISFGAVGAPSKKKQSPENSSLMIRLTGYLKRIGAACSGLWQAITGSHSTESST